MNRIKILREEHSDRQIDLATHLGISQNRLSNWERGVYQPPKQMLFKIADRYGVSTDYLMGYSDSWEFAETEPLRLLREYLTAKTGKEFKQAEIIQLDDIFESISGLLR